MKDKLIIIGAGGHGKVVADVAQNMNTYKEIFFLDDSAQGETLGIPIIGNSEQCNEWIDEADYFVAIGDSRTREKFILNLEKMNASIATLIHPKAVVSSYATIGKGTVIMAGAVINAGTKIGQSVIVNTASSIDHDNTIDDFCHISVGAHLAGIVKVGKHTMVGAGATVINNIEICDNCMIGAGTVVTRNIVEFGTHVGVPARKK